MSIEKDLLDRLMEGVSASNKKSILKSILREMAIMSSVAVLLGTVALGLFVVWELSTYPSPECQVGMTDALC